MSIGPWVRSKFDVFCRGRRAESSSASSASTNDCGADLLPTWAVVMPRSLRATVANDLPVCM